jgi:pSer/pThr/pTyr-binding forkhead associated (FHA) protein
VAAQIPVLNAIGGDRDPFPLRPGQSYIAGRSTEADLVINEDTVSRKHARFFERRGAVWVRDLGSRNGTFVNGVRVPRARLRDGDRLLMGAELFRVAWVSADSVKEQVDEAAESMGRSMSGNIKDIPLADVLQWLATSRKTGTLYINGARRGALSLEGGMVRHARIEGRENIKPDKALLRMLGWSEGGFSLDNKLEEIPEEDAIAPSLEGVLMEAARQQDELAHIASRSPIPDGTVKIANPSPVPWTEIEADDLVMLQKIYETPEWEDIIDTSDKDDVAMTKIIVKLHKKGLVEY